MPNTAELGSDLSGKKIILGITGSIAAYKSAQIASDLVKRCADVHVVMTESATKLIGKATFWSLTGNPVVTGLFDIPPRPEITHVSLSESADLLLIAPATANIIGKLAYGLADDMLSTMSLVVRCPILVAPAMNVNMYTNPVVAANIDILRQRGVMFIEPEAGRLACGDEGVGRLADPGSIVRVVEETLCGVRDYAGVKVVVTAGPTREPIDPVRYISNRSSGKMGYAIAEAAARRGAQVTLVSGPTELDAPRGVDIVCVETVEQMFEAVKQAVKDAQVFISAAAPADFTPDCIKNQKIKKTEHLTLDLHKAVDILLTVAADKGRTVMVGFAAETERVEEFARKKLESKKLDLIVANDVSGNDVFGSDSNQVTLISRSGDVVAWPRMSKREVASGILDLVKRNYLEEVV